MLLRNGAPARLKADDGAQTLEFALVAPVTLFLLFGIMYALLAITASVTLAHAASSAVRYASIPTDNIEPVYPTPDQVSARLFESTPFFVAGSCSISVTGDSVPNAPVALSVSCPFANPLGAALNGIGGLLRGGEGDLFGDTFTMSAAASGRRE